MAVWVLVVGTGILPACLRPDRHPITAVEVVGGTVRDNALLGVTSGQVETLFREALQDSRRFELLPPRTRPKGDRPSFVLELELPFTREVIREGRDGRWAEIGATVRIERQVDGTTVRYEVVSVGEAQITSEEERTRAMQAALRNALSELATSTHLQLAAFGKSDSALERDLGSEDGAVREFALRALSERQHPAVTEVLIKRLRSEDPELVRKAMGTLAEMREVRAVKPLIELTRGKDPGFVREIVFALAQIGGEEAMAYLYTVSQGHDDPQLREAAQQALGELELRKRRTAQSKGGSP